MASTYSALKIELLETGANSGTWGTATNVNLGDAILGEAITGSATVDFATDADVTITLTDVSTTQAARNLRLNITESSTGVGSVRNLILGSGCQIEKFYLINNTGTGAKTVKNTSGTGISVPAGKATLVYNNGTNVVDAASYFTSLTLGSALPVASGGTGLTAGTSGGIPAYTATGTLTSSGVLDQYGVVIGGGAGAVPTSTAVGTATHVLTSNGSGVAPTFQAIPGGGVTTFNAGTTGFTPNTATTGAVTLAGTLAIANGGTGTTSTTFANLTTNVTGTLPIANGGTGTTSTTFASLTTNVTGTLPIANGGTNGTATPTANGVTYGTGSTIAYTAAGTTGQVLTATTSSAPTWATPSSGALVYVSQVVASNSSTVSFTGLTAYDNYMIIWSKAFPDTASTINFHMLTSTDNGSNYATSSYLLGNVFGSSNNTSIFGRSSSSNGSFILLSTDSLNAVNANSSISGQVILNLKDSTKYNFQSWGQIAEFNDGGSLFTGAFSAARLETSPVDAIRFKFSSGNILTGTFRLYGIANS